MTAMQDPESNDDHELTELFRKTADAPSDLERSRMLARAADIASTKARSHWLTPRFLWPGALAAAAATAFLVLAPPGTRAGAPILSSSINTEPQLAPPPPVAAVASVEAAASQDQTMSVDESEDPAVAVLGEEVDDLDLGPLMSEDDLNAPSASGM